MNPRECESVQELLSFRLSASQRLSELQKETDLIIEDEDTEKEVKQTEIAKRIASTREKIEEDKFSTKVHQKIMNQIDHFEGSQ